MSEPSETPPPNIPTAVVAPAPAPDAPEEVLETSATPDGDELVLLRRGPAFEIRSGARTLIASAERRSEQALAELGLAPLAQRSDVTVLVAGLGMGHLLRAVLDMPGVVRVDVVELAPAIVAWNRTHLAALNGNALADPRVHVHEGELMSVLKQVRYTPLPEVADGWLAILLDVDDGPAATTRPANAAIYSEEGLVRLDAALRHGGVLGLWSGQRDVELLRRMAARFVNVAEMAVPVDVGGKPNLDYVYRGRRAPEPRAPGGGAKKPMAQA